MGLIALGTDSGEIIVWDLQQGEIIKRLNREKSDQAHQKRVNDVVFNSSGNRLFSCSDEKDVLEWDLDTEKVIRKFKGGNDGVSKLALSSDDAVLATASSSIKLWDLASGKKTKRLASGHTSSVVCLVFSSCNQYLFSAARSGRFVNVFDCSATAEKKPLYVFALNHQPTCLFVQFDQDVCQLGAVADSGSVYIWQKQLIESSSKPITPSAVASGDALHAWFCPTNTKNISLARGSSAKPLFDSVPFLTKEGTIVSELTIESASDNLLLQLDDLPSSEKKQKQLEDVHVVSVVEKNVPTQAMDLDDVMTDHGHSEGEEDLTLAERLEQLRETIDKSLPSSSASSGDQKSQEKAQPQSGSLVTVLEQALQSKDNSMLEYVLRLTDEQVINTTVERLSTSRVVPFLTRLVDKFEKRPTRGSTLCLWIRAILKHHTAYLMSIPDLVHKLSTLYQTLEARLSVFTQLYKVSGRLELVLDQIARRSTPTTSASSTQPQCIYSEE